MSVQMTVGRRIGLGVAGTLVVTLALVLVATAALRGVVEAKDDVINRSAALVADAHRIVASLNQEAALVRGFLLTGDDQLLVQRERSAEVFDTSLAHMQANARDPEIRSLVAEIPEAKRVWAEVAAELIEDRDGAPRADELADGANADLLAAFDRVETLGTAIAAREEALIDVATTEANDAAGDAARLVWLLGLGGIVLAAGIGAWTARSTSRGVEDLARSIDRFSADIVSGTEQQAASAAELAAAAQQTLATVEELSQTAQETARRARAVADTAQRAADSAEAGQRAVSDSVAGMGRVRQRGDAIAQTILDLADQAQVISGIAETVDDIAEQTHLLALNASIEAARAGEHGRGFAVVAAEVRSLAEESRRETKRVGDLVAEIQRATNAAVLATEEGNRTISSGEELVGSAGDVIGDLNGMMSEATLAAEQISGSAGQQAAGTAQITQAMRDVRTAIDQSAASARQSEDVARQLSDVAARLKALVGLG